MTDKPVPHFTDGNPEAQSCAQGHMTNSRHRLGPKSRALGFSLGSATHCCCGAMSMTVNRSCLFSGHPSSVFYLGHLEPQDVRTVRTPAAQLSSCLAVLGWAPGQSRAACGFSTAWLERSLEHALAGCSRGRWSLVTPGCSCQQQRQGRGGACLGVEAVIWLWCWAVAGW